jgi:hypothetical protein
MEEARFEETKKRNSHVKKSLDRTLTDDSDCINQGTNPLKRGGLSVFLATHNTTSVD